MADRNICDVELLDSMSENTNVLIEENGSLKKLNLKDEIDNNILIAKNEIEAKQNKSFLKAFLNSDFTFSTTNLTETIPLSSYYCSGDKFEIVDGKINILKNCNVIIMAQVYLYEGYTQYDIVKSFIYVTGSGGSGNIAHGLLRTIGINPYTTLNLYTIHQLSEGDTVSLTATNQNGARGGIASGSYGTFVTICEL